MAFSTWLCTKSTKSMLVKIVHPGGHVELHDSPVLAAELMLRNPRCCVAYPHIFQQPWAIVAPDNKLQLGQKYYVVPISTIRKLQRLSLKYSPNSVHEIQSTKPSKEEEISDDNMSPSSTCWSFINSNSPKFPYACVRHSNNEERNVNLGSNHARSTVAKDVEKEGCFAQDSCFIFFIMGTKIEGNGDHDDDLKVETKSSCSNISSSSSAETKPLTRKRINNGIFTRNGVRGLIKRFASLDHWQPSLQSISEE